MRILLITYHFPPDAAIGAVRPYQFARMLPAHGIETWVLTVAPQYAEQQDDSLMVTDIPASRIFRTVVRSTVLDHSIKLASAAKSSLQHRLGGSHELCHHGAANGRTAADAAADAAANGHAAQRPDHGRHGDNGWLRATQGRRLLMSWLQFPDDRMGWYRPALTMAHQILQQYEFDAIFSTSPPRAAHLVAYRMARSFNVPWIMDLRDPWYFDMDHLDSKPLEGLYYWLYATLATRADRVVLNTERLRTDMHARFPEFGYKSVAIPNGVRVDRRSSRPATPDRFGIGHYGSVYGSRTTRTFLHGLRLWLDARGAPPDALAVRFVGHEHGDAAEYIEKFDLSGVVDLQPAVSRDQVSGLMREDYMLLLLANDWPLQVPGKLYEYFAAGRRILATTEHEGSVADLIQDHPGCAIAETPQEVARSLDAYWSEFQSGAGAEISYDDLLQECSYENRTAALARLIHDIVPAPVNG